MLKRTLLLTFSLLTLISCGDNSNDKVEKEPANTPAVGTNIADIKKAMSHNNIAEEYPELSWDKLSPEGYEQNKIMDKYQPLIEKTPEGSPEENKIFDRMMSELNAAPANEKLNGQKIKIPGFVSPLEEKEGKVTEFLLVPYFGACIHVPPPPMNNTLLIKPKSKYAIPLDNIYEPIWVLGTIQVKSSTTDLAQAGYLIDDAIIEEYDVDAEAAKEETD